MTSTAPPTASTTSGSASIDATVPSSCRPPWFDTTSPSNPASTARRASSARTTPFSTNGRSVSERSHGTSSQSSDASPWNPMNAASPEPRPSGGRCTRMFTYRTSPGSWKSLRMSRSRAPTTGRSAVSMIAEYPAASARFTSSAVRSRSRWTYSWNQRRPPEAASATSSMVREDRVDRTSTDPTAAEARAVATSPSGSARPCSAVGATRTGSDTTCPSTVVAFERDETSTSTRGRRTYRENAARFSRMVHSSSAPPAK